MAPAADGLGIARCFRTGVVPGPVQVGWLTGTEALNRELATRLTVLHPELPLLAVSEFPVEGARLIPYHPKLSFRKNLDSIQEALRGETVRRASLLLVAGAASWPLRVIAVRVSGTRLTVFDSSLHARPWPGQVLRYWRESWRGPVVRWAGRVRKPREALVPILAHLAYGAGRLRRRSRIRSAPAKPEGLLSGTAVVIPSRDGLHLLRECVPRIAAQHPAQIVVVDNGSSDGTAAGLPGVEVVVSAEPLSFARAVNLGLQRVKHSRVLLLNNDMLVEPGFLRELEAAFGEDPELFCATAQILFPPGVRREETGKAVMRSPATETEFPVRCDVPLPNEDATWVLYGSGGCSLFDTAKLRALGGLNEMLAPAYVEDLDLGFRAWQLGWASVFRAGARVEHRHRATTSRYWTAEQIDTMVQVNYLRFLASAIRSERLFRRLWAQAIRRLHLSLARTALREAIRIPLVLRAPGESVADEESIFALCNGDVAVFGGRGRRGKPVVLIAAPYFPFPLSHGGAVRIYNLMRGGAAEFDWVLIAFQEQWDAPPSPLLELCAEITLVRRTGSHYRVSTDRPDTVEEFDSLTFHAALRQTVRKWRPQIVQLEWTQMAQYAADCAPAKTVLVEHDITFDLYEQMAREAPGNSELAVHLGRWRAFETAAWGQVDAVVAMSEKDRERIGPATVIPNGVDTERYFPSEEPVTPNTLLFVGSFAHHPNRAGMDWFLREVWPLLDDVGPELHIIAGMNPPAMNMPRVTVEGFVADVRPAYRRAAVVIVPLIASAGTNIKVLEALAMGKAVVSTSAGVNGLDVEGVTVADGAMAFASAVRELLRSPAVPAMGRYDKSSYTWARSAKLQSALYRELIKS